MERVEEAESRALAPNRGHPRLLMLQKVPGSRVRLVWVTSKGTYGGRPRYLRILRRQILSVASRRLLLFLNIEVNVVVAAAMIAMIAILLFVFVRYPEAPMWLFFGYDLLRGL